MAGHIQFEDIDFGFPGPAVAHPLVLSGFALEIEHGEFFCLLGPSGCGKTTVLNLLAGFEHPSAGTVRVGPVYTPPERRTCGYASALVAAVSSTARAR